ncbi:MAG: carbamoyl-phosphate synthase large subunit [Nitrospina sp.]|jgi:carbamoyl-phosphate synthase large subunit|nr:carbamoyl-phosphate synthase large subunit [Nitrospina sp.]MBT3856664.1 carbamoyl-phosphate synthase large subunit [Nitrospina sp.]MBT4103522.1 carbamoyl-phosphate synthase large subunit [Nitrospina sp.]MBT4388771.1 carbamoyl-phosphate synthase large subunit [Nitrospina sp.]MBT4619574.1 carbamoyl-phosphate synthase large subunit [Nitrospina sp.]
MPKRTDIKKILLIGSGPIIIGQACEFDYSGTQACKSLKEEGYEIILVNSNPATIMTDPEFADRTYIEPVTPEVVEKIIARDRPDALLPTMGGQTALNTALALADRGVLDKYNVELIGASVEAIHKAEDRNLFKAAMVRIGQSVPPSGHAESLQEAWKIVEETGFPAIIRPSFTLGGTGGSVAYTKDDFEALVEFGLKASPVTQVLIEKSLIGWKEYELEVMRDVKDNVVIICSIENLDPMGVHTGDSITVAPAQTLTDKEYQIMRNAAIDIIREIGVETGGSNIQFAMDPKTGEMIVIEMNPRVSRSSALASKATGFPIAKFAAKLAVGYSLDEIRNDITRVTPASFEPTLDYCVVKIPRFTFEKFLKTEPILSTQMKSVGEVMSIGRTFKEALLKSIRSMETGLHGFEEEFRFSLNKVGLSPEQQKEKILAALSLPFSDRLWHVAAALRRGITIDQVYQVTGIDPWFLDNMHCLINVEQKLLQLDGISSMDDETLVNAKKMGFSDIYLAKLLNCDEKDIFQRRAKSKIYPVFKRVDTCGAEFEAFTPYLYSTYEEECEADVTSRKKIMILGGGPNRIGQGIEFDYCCVHASFALKEDGYETIMVNCNPETVSTDYDTSDRLYFEPLTLEDILNITRVEKPDGVIVQLGGQTPLKLALSLMNAGVPIIGTSPVDIDRAENRKLFTEVLDKLGLHSPSNGTAVSYEEARKIAEQIGYPVVVRPSYVLGGRAMEIVYSQDRLEHYMQHAVQASPEHPILIDDFLEDATEIDVDAISDGQDVVIGGVMEHIEEAGIHSGDSACSLPAFSLPPETIDEIKKQTYALARELKVIGLMNIQFAVKEGTVYIIEVNPRASRTIPFVSKTIGVPLAKIAARVMAGKTLKELGFTEEKSFSHIAVKESVFPFNKFQDVDVLLGPEMKSTGEVMGIDTVFGRAFAKSQLATGVKLPIDGTAFISVKDSDKPKTLAIGRELIEMGYCLIATRGTADYLEKNGVKVSAINKVKEGAPHCVEAIEAKQIDIVINTVFGEQSIEDSFSLRRSSLNQNLPYCTTMAGASALVKALKFVKDDDLSITSIQEYGANS